MPTRTIAYLRVSTEKQADRGVSLDAQRARVKTYAELYDLELAEVIVHALPDAEPYSNVTWTSASSLLNVPVGRE